MKRRGELVSVKNLFSVYKDRLQPPQETVVSEMIVIIDNVIGVTLKKEQISYTVTSKTISIKAPSILKQEIQKNQGVILMKAKNTLGAKAPQVLL